MIWSLFVINRMQVAKIAKLFEMQPQNEMNVVLDIAVQNYG